MQGGQSWLMNDEKPASSSPAAAIGDFGPVRCKNAGRHGKDCWGERLAIRLSAGCDRGGVELSFEGPKAHGATVEERKIPLIDMLALVVFNRLAILEAKWIRSLPIN